jgi:hypothetical protein
MFLTMQDALTVMHCRGCKIPRHADTPQCPRCFPPSLPPADERRHSNEQAVDNDEYILALSVPYSKKRRLVDSSMILSPYAYRGDGHEKARWADNTTSRLLLVAAYGGDGPALSTTSWHRAPGKHSLKEPPPSHLTLGNDCSGGTKKGARASCSHAGNDDAPDTEDTFLLEDTSSSEGESGEDDGSIARRKTSPTSRVAASDKVVTGAIPTATATKAARKMILRRKGDNILSRVPWTEEEMKEEGSRPPPEEYPAILEEKNERKREKQRERYASMSKEKKDRSRKRIRDYKRAKHAAMTEQEKEERQRKSREYNREYYTAKRAAMTEQEEKDFDRKKREYERAQRAAMTEEEKEDFVRKKGDNQRARRAAMTEQEKEAYNLKQREYERAKRAAMTEEEKKAYNLKQREYERAKRAAMTEEEKKAYSLKQSESLKKALAAMTQEERDAWRQKQNEYRKKQKPRV